jgi:hypothetical protein
MSLSEFIKVFRTGYIESKIKESGMSVKEKNYAEGPNE